MMSVAAEFPRLSKGQVVLLACTFGDAGFSGERVFRIPASTEGQVFVGIAAVDYCLDTDRRPLDPGSPAKGLRTSGFVMGSVVCVECGLARIHLPDGGVIDIPAARVAFVRKVVATWMALDEGTTDDE